MKQKKCPQCKNLISVKAPTCLYCGRPNKFVTNNYVKRKWDKEHKQEKLNNFRNLISNKTLITFMVFLIILLISLYKYNNS
ncbi:hypothetical protein [Prochlorococcus marinus]|uniref:hypothetical protein n=1 Tax=Prochlorococcus marinus TaxID=1219 RepID=UPI0003076ED5|nr:hypothetical protein [Prochlorococcus marinus]